MKKLLTLCLASLTLSACVMDEVLNDVNPADEPQPQSVQVYGIPYQETRSIPMDEFARVSLCIKNLTSELKLKVKNIRICNIHQSGTYHFPSLSSNGYWLPSPQKTSLLIDSTALELAPNDSLMRFTNNGIPFIPQSISAWNPMVHPHNSESCYLLMDCLIFQGNENILIWGESNDVYSEVAIPLYLNLQKGKHQQIEIVLEHGCPWYDIRNSVPSPILNPITFDVTVEDWKSV